MSATTTSFHELAEQATSRRFQMLIGGELVDALEGDSYETSSPSTEQPLATAPAASAADVERAVAAAAGAFDSWNAIGSKARVEQLRRVIEIVLENEEELAVLDAVDSGNPVTAMRGDVRLSAAMSEPALEWVSSLRGETFPGAPDHLHYTVHEPYGVVARIIPYNHPLLFAARSVVPLLMGNTLVLKTPDQTPLSGLRLGELIADVLPPGVFNILSGVGPVAGDALVRHRDVRRIMFTGSPGTGRAIQRAAAESAVKHISLELGGKNPMIVFPDADVEAAAAGAVRGMNFHWTAGQSCGSTSRLLVHESLVDDVVDRVKAQVEQIPIGDPLDPAIEMGSQVSQVHYDKVMGYIEQATADGATLVTGGGRPEHLSTGFFIAPTVFRDVDPSSAIATEEVFGPVLSVLTWRDEDEMVKIANGVDYGLTASLWSRDLGRAQRVARRLETGYIWVNTCSAHFPGVPFGGYKDSGVGREEYIGELLSYTQTKALNVFLGS